LWLTLSEVGLPAPDGVPGGEDLAGRNGAERLHDLLERLRLRPAHPNPTESEETAF
jgi:hypothetical protein